MGDPGLSLGSSHSVWLLYWVKNEAGILVDLVAARWSTSMGKGAGET